MSLFASCGDIPARPGTLAIRTRDDALAQRVARITGETLPQEGPTCRRPARAAHGARSDAYACGAEHPVQHAAGQAGAAAHWNYAQDAHGQLGAKATGLEVHNSAYQSFTYVTGEFAQYYQAAGGRLRAPLSPADAFQQDIVPNLRKDGFRTAGAAGGERRGRCGPAHAGRLYSTGPVRKTARALVSDWKKGDQVSTVVMHWSAHESPDMVMWGYYLTVLDCTNGDHAREKEGLLKGLAGTQYDPASFRRLRPKRTAEGQPELGGPQRPHAFQPGRVRCQPGRAPDMVNGVNDAQMGIYRSQSESFDRGQGAWWT